MKHQSKILVLLLLAIAAISCSRKSTISKSETVTVYRDSVYEKQTVVFDTLLLPGDSILTFITVECDSVTNKPKPATSKSKSNNLTQDVSIDANGNLTARCIADSLMQIIISKDRVLSRYKEQLNSQKDSKTQVIEKRYIPKWVWYSLGANLVLGIWTFRKPIKALISSLIKLAI